MVSSRGRQGRTEDDAVSNAAGSASADDAGESSADDLGDRAQEAARSVEDGAEKVTDHPAFEGVARVGHAMNGLVHIMIGGIAVRLALTDSGGEADQTGALRAFSEVPGGSFLLGVGGVAMIALALWQTATAWFGARCASERREAMIGAARHLAKAVVYLVLAATALRFALGGSGGSGQQTTELTAALMQSPVGRLAVAGGGLVVIAIGGHHVVKGATRRFVRDLEHTGHHPVGTAVTVSGVAGYVAKGVALAAVGVLLGWAAVRADPEKAAGLDGALKSMASLPAGGILLTLVGAGLVLYGVHCFFRMRFADM